MWNYYLMVLLWMILFLRLFQSFFFFVNLVMYDIDIDQFYQVYRIMFKVEWQVSDLEFYIECQYFIIKFYIGGEFNSVFIQVFDNEIVIDYIFVNYYCD